METKLISLGLCESIDLNGQSKYYNFYKIRNYFNNTLFQFSINSEKIEDHFATNSRYRSYKEQTFKLLPKGGYFNPVERVTKFYDNDTTTRENQIIIRQPVFFVILLPYPSLLFFNNYHNYGSTDWASNPYPFKNLRFNSKISRKENFSEYRLKTDLEGEIKIDNTISNHDSYNNFFNNNNFPLFIEDHDELITIINDLDSFYYNTLGFRLKLENISKIIIPFFELTASEAMDLSRCKADSFPF